MQTTNQLTCRSVIVKLLMKCGLPREIAEKIYDYRYKDYQRTLLQLRDTHYNISVIHKAFTRGSIDDDLIRLVRTRIPGAFSSANIQYDVIYALQSYVPTWILLGSYLIVALEDEDSIAWEVIDPKDFVSRKRLIKQWNRNRLNRVMVWDADADMFDRGIYYYIGELSL